MISKARFFEISRGLEELFRGSNAQLLASRHFGPARQHRPRPGRAASRMGMARPSVGRRSSAGSARTSGIFRKNSIIIRQGRERLNAMAEAIHHLARVSDGIQAGVLETRMVPIGPLFDRFHRVIRDLRQSSDKEVGLKIEGEKTELDKRMVDELADPLVHMVRNSVDHGARASRPAGAGGQAQGGNGFARRLASGQQHRHHRERRWPGIDSEQRPSQRRWPTAC